VTTLPDVRVLLDVHFEALKGNGQQVSVGLEVVRAGPHDDVPDQFWELFLMASFAIRQLVNMGPRDTMAWSLAYVLKAAHEAVRQVTDCPSTRAVYETIARNLGVDLIGHLLWPDLTATELGLLPILEHCGSPARKGFVGELRAVQGVYRFVCRSRGLGLLSPVSFYASHAVVALFRFLAQKHIDDEEYLRKLGSVVRQCADSFSNGQLRVKGQLREAYVIASSAFSGDE